MTALPASDASAPLPSRALAPDDRASSAWSPPGVPLLAGVCVVALGLALDVNYGQYDPRALMWLAVALASGLLAVGGAGRLGTSVARAGGREAAGWLAAVGVQAAVLLGRDPAVPGAMPPAALVGFRLLVLFVALCAAGAVVGPSRRRGAWVTGMLAAHLLAGVLVLRACPAPGVDVIVFQRDACAALLGGRSPYGITFPDVSPPGTDFYAPGVSVGGRLQFGFPYPPASLLMVLPFHLLGDFRLAGLLATTAAGWLIARGRPGPRASAAAALLLLTPSGFFVLWAGWTEPLVVALLALVVFVAARGEGGPRRAGELRSRDRKGAGESNGSVLANDAVDSTAGPLGLLLEPARSTPPLPYGRGSLIPPRAEARPPRGPTVGISLLVAFGLLLSVKQYAVLLLPLVVLIVPRGGRRALVLGALAVAALVSLPLALTDVDGFVRSVVWLQFRQPYRPDALSFLAPLHGVLPHAAASAVPLALAALAIAWAARRCPRTPAGFALAASVALLVFFALNKQAFCNYYHLVVGGLCCAVGAWGWMGENDQAPMTNK